MFPPDSSSVIPCVLFEDEHLLVVNKPAGVNTHAPSPFGGEGIYDWLRHREPRWASLAIIHRLDKETSGVMVFGKTSPANRSLTEQFAGREVRKRYLLLTDRSVARKEFTVQSEIRRVGEKYASGPGGEPAETLFRVAASRQSAASLNEADARHSAERPLRTLTVVTAEPHTGRTHQIRVHAAESGFPILGDTLYGGTPAERVFLHAAELRFQHPETGAECEFKSPDRFGVPALAGQDLSCAFGDRLKPGLQTLARRLALIDPAETNAFRLIHGASDGWPGWYVERLGDFLLSQSELPLSAEQRVALERLLADTKARGAYHKRLDRQVRRTQAADASPQWVAGEAAPERFEIHENGVRYELSFNEGYSVGLFLDQRDNRRRFLTGHVAAGFSLDRLAGTVPPSRSADVSSALGEGMEGGKQEGDGARLADWTPQAGQRSALPIALRGLNARSQFGRNLAPSEGERNGVMGSNIFELLNAFAYTCGFSVCAALGGARTTSLDLSKKYLEWGKRNFALNGLDPAQHDFIYGDTFDWLRRLAKKGRAFDAVVLDPPTFSQSKESGVFRAEKDYGKLVQAALPVLKPGGVLLASTNAAEWPPELFVEAVQVAVRTAGRRVEQEHFVPQPLDFPITRSEPGYLKTFWVRVS